MQAYSDPEFENDPHALPDLEIFQLTALERAEGEEDLIYEYMKKPEFRLAGFNSRVRDAMFDAMIEAEGIKGGWFYWYCIPGCLPDSGMCGPFNSWQEAKAGAIEEAKDS